MPRLPRYDADGSYRGLHHVDTPLVSFEPLDAAASEAISAPPAVQARLAHANAMAWAELRAEASERGVLRVGMKRAEVEAAVEAARVGG